MSSIEAPCGDPDPENPSSLQFRDAHSSASSEVSSFDDSDDQSWHSVFESTIGRFSGEIEDMSESQRRHFGSESSSEVDLESGELEEKVHLDLGKVVRDCRICHLEIGRDSEASIELGCCCRGDLGIAHKQCAETWFKIKGNTICEICGATAQNVANQQTTEPTNSTIVTSLAPTALPSIVETSTIFQGRRIMNFLLACMLLAFALSWLFHFKIMS